LGVSYSDVVVITYRFFTACEDDRFDEIDGVFEILVGIELIVTKYLFGDGFSHGNILVLVRNQRILKMLVKEIGFIKRYIVPPPVPCKTLVVVFVV
jgi:hypothetical protein